MWGYSKSIPRESESEMDVKTATRITRNAIRRAGIKDATISSKYSYSTIEKCSTIVVIVTYPEGSDVTALRSQIDGRDLISAATGSCAATITYWA